MFFYALLVAPVVLYSTWSLLKMEIRYRKAASMGIPLIRMPIDPLNPLWLIFGPIIWDYLDLLPINYGTFKYSRRGWFFFDKADAFLKYGPIWGFVTPADVYLHLADANATQRVYSRRLDFVRPHWLYSVLDVYGPSVSTANTADWPKHRKVVASPFNEKLMSLVWTETVTRSKQLVGSWAAADCSKFSGDVRELSLNILAASGFRRPLEFEDNASNKQHGVDVQGYRNALQLILDNAVWLMVFPYKRLTSPWLPRSWRELGHAGIEFKKYMEIMLDQAFQAKKRGETETGDLMTSFVRAVDASGSRSLTVDEIFGNLFVINFAGHDTTANTITFLILLLAIHPEAQDWLGEEITKAFPSTGSTWDYDQYTKLARCQAVLLETLRLYPPNPQIPKWTNEHPQTLRVGENDLVLPANTGIMLCPLAMQTLPQYWPNALEWQPSRWITKTETDTSGTVEETLVEPEPGTYFPWSNGVQNCPGEKFAKVEAVAVVAAFFRSHRVRVMPNPGEGQTEVLKRAKITLEDCDLKLITRMKNADKVRLQWRSID